MNPSPVDTDRPTSAPALPAQARVVIVGGGIAGCSTAYHLARMGITDVLVLEQGKLTSGTTWHAAGLIGQMRPNRSMTQMSKYGIELYATLEAETGLATGWKRCGSLNVAASDDRWKVFQKQAAMARAFGVECHVISPREAAERYPLLRTDDLRGALWLRGMARPIRPTCACHWPKAHASAGCALSRMSRSPVYCSTRAAPVGWSPRRGWCGARRW